MAPPRTIADYIVLPIGLPSLPSFPEAAAHYLYLRPHEPKVPSPDSARSLFLVNVPTTSTEAHFKHLFGSQLSSGRVERVEFHDAPSKSKKHNPGMRVKKQSKKRKRNNNETLDELQETLDTITLPSPWDRELQGSGSHAVAVFVDRASMEASLKAAEKASKSKTPLIIWGEGVESTDKVEPLGSRRYQMYHKLRYPARADLLRTVQDYMTIFSTMEDVRHRLDTMPGEPDEDGFVTVTRGSKINNAAREEELAELLRKQKEKQKGLEDFYRFQMREKRKERQTELLQKFEEDKKKVLEMKQRRGKVKPE
ncbi:Ribosomal RNA-processing protein 7 [Ascosphaera aggregata]|nr:Ribosomal RNA-processing protein 7 [Ascosphaera aggregata]